MKNFIKTLKHLFCKNYIIPIILIFIIYVWLFTNGFDDLEVKNWLSKPIANITIQDALILIIIFSFFTKRE